MACGNFIFIFFILYLVSRAFTWHAAMFGLGVRQGEFWVNVVTARKAGVAIVHAHKIVQFCANDNNAQLCEIVQTGWGFCTHTLQTLSLCTCHYFSDIMYFIHSIQEGFYTDCERLHPKCRKAWLHICGVARWDRGGTTSGGGSYTRDNDRTNTHTQSKCFSHTGPSEFLFEI